MAETSALTELPEECMHIDAYATVQPKLHARQAHKKRRHVPTEASTTRATTLRLLPTGTGSAAAHVLQKNSSATAVLGPLPGRFDMPAMQLPESAEHTKVAMFCAVHISTIL